MQREKDHWMSSTSPMVTDPALQDRHLPGGALGQPEVEVVFGVVHGGLNGEPEAKSVPGRKLWIVPCR